MRSRLNFILILIFTLLNIVDLITGYFILDGESNPIYLLTNSFAMLLLFKVLVNALIVFMYYKSTYPSRFWYFSYVYFIIIGIFLLTTGIASNLHGMQNEEVVDEASDMSTGQKAQSYFNVIYVLLLLPYFLTFVSFLVYDKTEKFVRYEKR
mgnify:FL=1